MTTRSMGRFRSGFSVLLTSLLLMPAEARPDQPSAAAAMSVGSKVRILAPSVARERIEGMVLAAEDDSLLVGTDSGPVKVPREAITHFEVSTGRHRRVLKGALIGAGIGALIKKDRWSPVPRDAVRVSLRPTRGRGVAVAVSVGF